MTTLTRFALVWTGLLAAASVAPAAELTLLSGVRATGTVVQVDAEFVTFQEDGRGTPSKFPVKEIAVVDLKNKVAPPPKDAKFDEIELTDGTRLRAADLRLKGKKVEAALLAGPQGVAVPAATIDLSHLFFVMRGGEDPANKAGWTALLKNRGKRDLFVVRQTEGLNPLPGTVIEGNETGERITFEREDGNRSSLPLTRATGGLVFNQIPKDEIAPKVCKVVDVFGNVWIATAVEVVGSGMKVKTVSGAAAEFASLQGVSSLDFSQGNVEYLSALGPKIDYAAPEKDGPLGEKFPFAPQVQTDKALNGADLVLDGKKYAKGLSIPPDTTLTFPIEGYREFKAVVGIADGVRPEEGVLSLKIEIDGRAVLTEKVAKKDKPREVNLNVKDAKELKITVERDTLFAGNQLNLADARVQK